MAAMNTKRSLIKNCVTKSHVSQYFLRRTYPLSTIRHLYLVVSSEEEYLTTLLGLNIIIRDPIENQLP